MAMANNAVAPMSAPFAETAAIALTKKEYGTAIIQERKNIRMMYKTVNGVKI